jgi:hypothetical protein
MIRKRIMYLVHAPLGRREAVLQTLCGEGDDQDVDGTRASRPSMLRHLYNVRCARSIIGTHSSRDDILVLLLLLRDRCPCSATKTLPKDGYHDWILQKTPPLPPRGSMSSFTSPRTAPFTSFHHFSPEQNHLLGNLSLYKVR